MSKWRSHRYLIIRRLVQFTLLFLFAAANYFGWKLITGTYSSANVLNSVTLSDPYAVLQMFATGFIASTDLIVGALIVFLFYALIAGRSFCSWVCPVNIISETSSWLHKKMNLKNSSINLRLSRKSRFYLMLLGLGLSAIIGISAFEIINPISMIHRGIIFGFGGTWTVILFLFLFELLIKKHGWCGYLCPLGGFYSMISKINIIKVFHTKENCTACNLCFQSCPEVHVLNRVNQSTGFIFSGDCTNCGRCIDVCDDKALKYSINKFNYQKNIS